MQVHHSADTLLASGGNFCTRDKFQPSERVQAPGPSTPISLRCRIHSGKAGRKPSHGRYTKAAIAERREVQQLLRGAARTNGRSGFAWVDRSAAGGSSALNARLCNRWTERHRTGPAHVARTMPFTAADSAKACRKQHRHHQVQLGCSHVGFARSTVADRPNGGRRGPESRHHDAGMPTDADVSPTVGALFNRAQ